MTKPRYLVCNPALPGYINAPNSVTSEGDCGHLVKVSPSGVGLLLTTPGIKTCCLYCVKRMAKGEDVEWAVPAETAAEFKETTGLEISPEFLAKMARWVEKIQR